MAKKKDPTIAKVKDLNNNMDQILRSLMDLQTKIDECKELERKGIQIKLTATSSVDIVVERMDGAIASINRTLREHEEDNFEEVVKSLFRKRMELQSKTDELAEHAKRGTVAMFGFNSIEVARDRLAGIIREVDRSIKQQLRALDSV